MAGTDENVAMIGDWMPPNPSPRTLMSTFLTEDFGSKSFSDFLSKNENLGPPPKTEDGEKEAYYSTGQLPAESNWFGAQRPNTHGGLAERISANGFSVPKLNTSLVGAATSSSANLLTIPPGLSPTSLLQSPVFLSNSTVQQSPTTGKFQSGQYCSASPTLIPVSEAPAKVEEELFNDVPETFAFKPHIDSHSLFFSDAERKVVPYFTRQQSEPSTNGSLETGKGVETGILENGVLNFRTKQDSNVLFDSKVTNEEAYFNRMSDSFMGGDHSPPLDEQQECEGDQGDQKGEHSSVTTGAPAEDGYNWRKYGQKQVKGSEYPRSYYKCTHLNCQVKKKVERSHEGHITEIIYKGSHNHPKPSPARRTGIPSNLLDDQHVDGSEQPGSQPSFDGKSTWAGTETANGGQDWRNDGLETSSVSLAGAEFCNPSTNMQHNQECPRLSSDGVDASSTMSNDEDEDRATHGSVSLGCDGDGDETESKRRKLEACAIEMNAASRAVREPRVVIQTTSEVDILDDGYRWRKYGQKVVKGNPNPRSYYKCTHPGCTVRKHVERASHDLKSVITTYEGKHNHDVPAARNSGLSSSAPSNASATSVSQPHGMLRRVEPMQDGFMRFDGQQHLGTYSLSGREQIIPPTGFSLAMSQSPFLAGLTMPGMGPMRMPVYPPVHPYLGHQQATDGRYAIPKAEPEEQMQDSRLPMPNGGAGPAGAGAVYNQMMGRLPLGPHL